MSQHPATQSPLSPLRRHGIGAMLSIVAVLATVFTALVACHGLAVHGDAAATARNLLCNRTLYELGFAANLIVLAFALS